MNLKVFIRKRLLQLVIVFFITSVLVFVMIRMSNVDPVSVILGGKQTSPETIENVRIKFGLDKPQIQQYFEWIMGLFTGDLGFSYKFQQPVIDMIKSRVPVTLGLVTMGSVMALIIAIPLGVLSAVKKNTFWDSALSIISLILVSCPTFLTGIIMIIVMGKVNPSYSITGTYTTFAEFISRCSLPALALAFSMIALAMRVTRTGMIEQLQSNYIETAKAKGLSTNKILFGHALKNAIIPLISVISIQIGSMIVGAVLVENVFSLAGLGSLLITSIKSSDYPVVQSITMILVLVFLVISTLTDIIYALIDPRMRKNL